MSKASLPEMDARTQLEAVPPVIGGGRTGPARKGLHNWWAPVAGALVLALIMLYEFNPTRFPIYPRCALYAATGLYCPGCGGLRAVHQLLHGHVLTALQCNPLFILSLPWLAWFTAKTLAQRLRHGNWPEIQCGGWPVFWFCAAMLLFTILRNIPGEPFCLMVPPAGI